MACILIVEDSRLIIHLARSFVTSRGHRVAEAHDGQRGLELARQEHPDLVLLDLVLPGMDGYEVCHRLKSDPETRDIPVIMLTSRADPADKVKGFEMGAVDYVTKPFDEWELLARVNTHLRIKELYEALQEQNRQLQDQADRDGLTGLHNHRFFREQLKCEFARARRYDHPLSCALLDIDHFKKVNDTHGHQAGDEILKGIGSLIAECLREGDLAARYGGEEFAVLLHHTALDGAMEALDRIRWTVGGHEFRRNGVTIRVSVSAGVADVSHERIKDPNDLVECADRALYAAKGRGRNRVEPFL